MRVVLGPPRRRTLSDVGQSVFEVRYHEQTWKDLLHQLLSVRWTLEELLHDANEELQLDLDVLIVDLLDHVIYLGLDEVEEGGDAAFRDLLHLHVTVALTNGSHRLSDKLHVNLKKT